MFFAFPNLKSHQFSTTIHFPPCLEYPVYTTMAPEVQLFAPYLTISFLIKLTSFGTSSVHS